MVLPDGLSALCRLEGLSDRLGRIGQSVREPGKQVLVSHDHLVVGQAGFPSAWLLPCVDSLRSAYPTWAYFTYPNLTFASYLRVYLHTDKLRCAYPLLYQGTIPVTMLRLRRGLRSSRYRL